MGQRQNHRGKHPQDAKLFDAKWVPVLWKAVTDLSYLLTRGYAEKAARKLVGDHYQLSVRQRRAMTRAACSDASLAHRKAHLAAAEELAGRCLVIDGYNLLISVESALSRGILLRGRDGCIRDMASLHGSYRKVHETLPAVHLMGELLHKLGAAEVRWYFDAPVSNSAKLKTLLRGEAEKYGWNWHVELDHNVDRLLAASSEVVVTGDSWILDRVERWGNLMDLVVDALGLGASVIDIGGGTT